MAFWDKHEADRDRFTIVAIHDQAAKSFAQMDEKLREKGILQRWGGRNLPFPVLLDPGNKTTKAYGIQFFPTVILIDPEGNLVQGGDEATLERALAGGVPAKRE